MTSFAKWVFSFAVCCLLYSASPALAAAPAPYREAQWEDLVPKTWRPDLAFDGLDIGNLPDDDPRVQKAYEKFMREWANAPTNQKVHGQRIKIPGFIAPLDWEKFTELKEFLLVPYFGACIHLPPPPANQIIYIKLEKPLKGFQIMEPIWAYGTISVEKTNSGDMGASGYTMKLDKAEAYSQ